MSYKLQDYMYFNKNNRVLTVSPGTIPGDMKKEIIDFCDIRFQEKELKECYMIPTLKLRKKVKRKKKSKRNYRNK